MTTLIERIKNDQTAARLAKDAAAVSVLTPLFSEAAMVGKNAGNRPSTDDEVVATVRKFLKGVNETVAERTKRGLDVSEQEAEIAILNRYLPQELAPEAVEAMVREIVDTLGVSGAKGMGQVVKTMRERLGSGFNGATMSPIIKRVLG